MRGESSRVRGFPPLSELPNPKGFPALREVAQPVTLTSRAALNTRRAGEMGRQGDREMGRQGDGETRRQGEKCITNFLSIPNFQIRSASILLAICIEFQVSSFEHQVSSFEHQVSSFKFRVLSFEFRVSSIEFRASKMLALRYMFQKLGCSLVS